MIDNCNKLDLLPNLSPAIDSHSHFINTFSRESNSNSNTSIAESLVTYGDGQAQLQYWHHIDWPDPKAKCFRLDSYHMVMNGCA